MSDKLFNAIIAYSDEYHRRFLAHNNADDLERNWWQALDFFLARVCAQGRRDALSERVHKHACCVLSPLFSVEERDKNYDAHSHAGWKDIEVMLQEGIGKGKVGKGGDVKMIVSALSFIGELPGRNIIACSISRINAGELQQHYQKLQGVNNGIHQVGMKTAALYLRDVVSVFQLTDKVDNKAAFCLQAIDTWVKKVAMKLGIVGQDTDDVAEIQQAIVSFCEKHKVSALRFNQGAWLIGSHAFELILERLSK